VELGPIFLKRRTPFERPLPSEGKGHAFESCRVRQFFLLQRDMRAGTKTPTVPHSNE
jgi:hypothetical protein